MTGLFDLTGRVAVVTGGNGGIGLAMARAMAGAGADLVLTGRDAAKGETAVAEITGLGRRAAFVTADVKTAAGCEALVAQAAEIFGGIDILINNAGVVARKRPEHLTLADWEHVLTTNLTAAFLLSQGVYPVMQARGGGKIINIASMLSLFGVPTGAAYGASKGGLVQLTRSLAAAWAPQNIQVNAVLPGWIATDMGASAKAQVEGLEQRVLARTPAGRWGLADDLGGVAVFLASGASDFVTGASIPVDGGFSMAG